MDAAVVESLGRKFTALKPVLNERARRQWAAAEALELGWGGISSVAKATGISRVTINTGIKEIQEQQFSKEQHDDWIRRPGGGRKKLVDTDPKLMEALESLVDPVTRGDPMSPLRWTCKSTRKLSEELHRQHHPVGARTVASLLREAGYSLQANRKTREGKQHPDRNAQFEYINKQVTCFHKGRKPAISVDTKKKELVGDFANGGREWQPKGEPEETRGHDFPDKVLGKAIPYGIYDMLFDEGWVSVGINRDTSEFASNAILRWWQEMGSARFPRAAHLLITADGGGSNSHRTRLWKVCLQKLADELGFPLTVCHFPPGTSKWNKIEHRLFSFITQNWRGRPLTTRQAIVELISNTTTRTGLTVRAALDISTYEKGIKISDSELASVKLTRHAFHGDWNYTIRPRK